MSYFLLKYALMEDNESLLNLLVQQTHQRLFLEKI